MAATPNFTYFQSGIGVQKSDGTFVDCIDINGNIDAPVTTTDLVVTGTLTGVGTSASALTVGANGATNPVLKVNANTASVATGLTIVGAAAAGGVALAAISSGTNENLTLDAKGSGTISLGTVSTGAIVLGRATGVTGALTGTSNSATALAVGRLGATTPALLVDASAATSITGLKVTSAASGAGVALAAIGETNVNTTIDAAGSGTLTLNGTATGAITLARATGITGALTGTSASATAFAVGRLGATTPALVVDASAATSITGLKITSAAAGAGLAIAAVGETNVNTTLDAAGSGTMTINGTATGNIVLGRATTGVSLGLTGAASAKTGTAVPATAGAVAAGAPLVLNSNLITIEATTDVPTHTRPKGSLCINLGGGSTTTRMYVNTDGAGTWTAFTTAA